MKGGMIGLREEREGKGRLEASLNVRYVLYVCMYVCTYVCMIYIVICTYIILIYNYIAT